MAANALPAVVDNQSDGATASGHRAIPGGRRPDLQGMRAVAVLAVFSNHLFNWPSGGFVGVDVFFVLSGFFITGLLIRKRTSTGKLSFRHFYIRRVKRIVPSAVLVLTATVIGSYLLFPAIRARETLVDALYASVFAANYHDVATGADYFQKGQPPSPLLHFWSLSIEEQFYFVWPASLVVIFGLTGRFWSGNARGQQCGLFGATALVVVGSFLWALLLSADDPNRAYFSTFTRGWELGVGALVAIAGPWLARIPSAVRPGLAYGGLAGVVLSLLVIGSTVQFPAPWAVLPVLSTALVIASFHGVEVRSLFPLTNSAARYFGDTSYTLYLWHWPVSILLLERTRSNVTSSATRTI
jgi:peptidoglycan/LPS O-acetylase OafA/YrhL